MIFNYKNVYTIKWKLLNLFILIWIIQGRELKDSDLDDDFDIDKFYTNGWAVQLKGEGSHERAKRLAKKYGFENVRKIGTLDGFYYLEHPHHPERSKRSSESKTELLRLDDEVHWVEQQHEYKRDKRGVHHQRVVTRGIQPRFADPLWEEQWYLDDKRSAMDLDVNVIPVWNNGISGKGVVVTILDDGIEHNHTDLARNYDPAASWDVNDNDPDPFPRYDPTNENKHGTRCAGEVAAQANNTKCGVGVAYNSKIGGVRMLDGRVTDRVEAESLSLNPQYIDIYSASWGPSDDGMTVEGPGTLASAAFLNGITKGRAGLGSIYVWASGNGGRHDDSCNCDGYTASIYTLSISSSSDHGESPWYSEACASTLATTLSSGAHGEKRIVTTDLHNQCTERHTGTSASAPLAAGIIALALEQNPKLSWRDIQHIVVHTANWIPLKRDPDWRMNGIGLHVNEKFGFGLLDSERIVKMAEKSFFITVPDKSECKGKEFQVPRTLRWDQPLALEIESEGCAGSKDELRYLEHVQLMLSIEYSRRGDLVVTLTSPMGTRSCLLPVRSEDTSDEGFKKWAFMTTHMWGEDPRGKWTLEIKDGGESRSNTGVLRDWQLILHGTKTKPNHQNVTHPEIPIHRKAVPDDIQNNAKSSVQITQITYMFGDQSSSSAHNVAPQPNNEPQNIYSTTSQMYPTQNILPTVQQALPSVQQAIIPYAAVPNPVVSTQNTGLIAAPEYNYNTNTANNNIGNNNNNNNFNYAAAAARNDLTYPTNPYPPAPSAYANMFNSQTALSQLSNQQQLYNNGNPQPIANTLTGRSIGWDAAGPQSVYPDPNTNLWDFFGRMNRRSAIVIQEEEDTNSLIKALDQIRNFRRR